ncbi:MAG: hypothetical protein Q4G23_06915 [Clostridia bacterium]|nr:hypothetical protein [Clostridia bacterium]
MQYVNFFGYNVSKLILGDNPFNGHSYITDYISGDEMSDFHTEAKIFEILDYAESLGINTMLPLADPYIIRVLQHYRNNGGKMNFIFQLYAPMRLDVTMRQIMTVDPIGVYISGSLTDSRYETDKNEETLERLAALKTLGIKVGLGTHHPEVIALSERENWNPDFYLACMYNFRRNREGQESGFITGKSKSGVIALPRDRAIMLDALKEIKKPIVAFKFFAGGQSLVNKTEEERHSVIYDAYDTVFSSLKKDDFGAIGIFQKYHDQLKEDVSVFNKWAEGRK